MRHRKHTVIFGRQRSHYKATLNHLVYGLIINKRIITTKVRAKEASRLAEKLVTTAKNKTVANQRKAYSVLRNRDLVKILFDEIAPLFKDRNGGYTRVILTNRRRGDNAQMAILEFVEKPKEQPVLKEEKKKEPVKSGVGQASKVKVKEETVKTRPQKEKVVEKKEEPKKVVQPSKESKKPEEKPKPKHGFFKKLFGRNKDK